MRVVPPHGAVARAPKPLTLDEVPNATVVYHGAWDVAANQLSVACVTRPLPLWVDALVPTILGGMNGLARRHLAVSKVEPLAVEVIGEGWRQPFFAEGAGAPIRGRHDVGFTQRGDLLACTSACIGEEQSCGPALAELVLEPGFAPRPSTVVEDGLASFLAHPRKVVTGVAVLLLVGVVMLLRRRPLTVGAR